MYLYHDCYNLKLCMSKKSVLLFIPIPKKKKKKLDITELQIEESDFEICKLWCCRCFIFRIIYTYNNIKYTAT